MDVLIVERDDLIAELFADVLGDVGITAEIAASEELAISGCHNREPRVVITGMNRHGEDLQGMRFGRAMRAHCPWVAVVYLAALWPEALKPGALDEQERFLAKPVRLGQLVKTVIGLLPA